MEMFCASTVGNVVMESLFLVLLCLVTLLIVFLGVWLIQRTIGLTAEGARELKPNIKPIRTLIIIMLGAFVLRLICVFLIKGYREDFDFLTKSIGIFFDKGLNGYFATSENFLMPITAYIYYIFGGISRLFGVTNSSIFMQFFLKMPLILADLGIVALLYKIVTKYTNQLTALVVSGMYAFCPVFLVNSAISGQYNGLVAIALLAVFYFAVKQQFLAMTAMYSVALLTDRMALYLLPLIMVFGIYHIVKSIKFNKDGEPLVFGDMVKHKERGLCVRLPLYFVGSLIVMYIACLPFIISSANPFTWFDKMFLAPLSNLSLYSNNSLSIFNIFGKNQNSTGSGFPSLVFSLLFYLLITAVCLVVYLSKKNRANLSMLAAYIIITIGIYFVNSRESTLVPTLVLLLLAFTLIKDKRLLKIFGVFSMIILINSMTVLISAEYLNNAPDYLFNTDLFTGTIKLVGNAGAVVNIICSVLAVLAHGYFTYVLLDISMSNKRKQFEPNYDIRFGKSLIEWFGKK